MRPPESASVGERLKSVREAMRLEQRAFVERLNAVSRALFGRGGPTFDQGRVSRLETNKQRASLEDIAVYATIDPKRRGKLKLAWNETHDVTMVEPLDTAIPTDEDERRTPAKQATPEREEGGKAWAARRRKDKAAPKKGGRNNEVA
jgi:transcriptional regulator with XRE-family HTH domain